jgi:TP901 family phage tail tape measure protein
MAESARSKLKVEIGADLAEADFALRGLVKAMQAVRKEGATGIKLDNLGALKAQVEAGIKPINELKRALAENLGQSKLLNRISPSPVHEEAIAKTTRALQVLTQWQRKAIEEASVKAKSDFFKNLELQAKAGVIPLTKLRDEMVKTIRTAIAAKANRADFVNDEEILRDIAALKKLNQEIAAVGRSNAGASAKGQFAAFGQSLQQALLPLAGATATIVLALREATTAGHEFGTQLRLISTIGKQSAPALRELGDEILRASGELQTPAVELAAANYEILSSGITNASEAFDVMTQSAKLSKAGVSTAAEAADILTSSLNALGGTPARNAEILFKAVDLGKVKVSEMAESFGGVAAQARIAGVSLEEIAASVATLSLIGKKPSEGLTGLQSILTALSKQSQESQKQAKAIGLEFNTAALRAKGLAGFIKDVMDKSKGSDEVLSKLFGRVEGLNAIMALGSVSADTYADTLEQIKNSSGSLEEAFQRTLNPIDGFANAIKNMSISAGQNLNQALSGPLKSLAELANALRDQKDLLAFATGVAAVVAALGLLATGLSAIITILAPLGIALGALAAFLGVSLWPVILGVTAAFGLLAAAGGIWVVAANKADEATKLASRSMADLDKSVNEATESFINSSRSAIQAGKSFDQMAKKTNKTTAEKEALRQKVQELAKQFPSLLKDIDKLSEGYLSLEEAIRKARIEQAKLTKESDLKTQLDKINDQIREQEARASTAQASAFTPAGFAGATIANPAGKGLLASLVNQKKKLLVDLKNVDRDVKAQIEKADSVAAAADSLANQGLNVPDPEEEKKILKAKQDLNDKIKQMEVELTGFTQGEFAKRRADADKNFQEDVRRIRELGEEAKASQAEISKGIADAARLRQERLAEIAKQEAQAVNDAKRTIQDLKANVQALNAELTLGNPFDDITADAEKARVSIIRDYALSVRALQEMVKKNPKLAGLAEETKGLLRQEMEAKLQGNRIVNDQRYFEEGRALADLQQQNKVLQAEIAGDTLKIEQATNAKVLADLQLRIEKQKGILTNAVAALGKDPGNKDLQLGAEKALADLENLQLEHDKQKAQSAKNQAVIETNGIELVIDTLKQEIDLYGKRPELVRSLVAAYGEYIKSLEKERALNKENAEIQADIAKRLREARKEQAGLAFDSTKLGQAAKFLTNIDLPDGKFKDFFGAVGSGLLKLREQFQAFASEEGNAGKTFGDFAKSGKGLATFASLAGSALTGLGKVVGSTKSAIGDLTSALGGAVTGAATGFMTGGPIGAVVGGLMGGISGIAKSGDNWLGRNKGKIIGAVLGGIGGFFLGKMFDDAKKKQRQQQKKDEKAIATLESILGGADQNDLNSLNSALAAASAVRVKGKEAKSAKASAIAQLSQAIENRKKVIAEAIRSLKVETQNLNLLLAQVPGEIFKNLQSNMQIQANQLDDETKRLLEQFKDSTEAQALIEKTAAQKRQLLYQNTSLEIIDTLIDEQNQIRALRAQRQVDEAEATDDAIAHINARLQAELVRIDNEIVAFKGAEEAKTEFLAAKAAERDRIIKNSQKQLDGLLRQGLDILNEGLVTNETKFDSQSRRLKELFGSNLNPFGLIQAQGSLLKRDITIGAGGIQFIFEGVQDAQGLIAQLDDPVVQAKLLDKLNEIMSRN